MCWISSNRGKQDSPTELYLIRGGFAFKRKEEGKVYLNGRIKADELNQIEAEIETITQNFRGVSLPCCLLPIGLALAFPYLIFLMIDPYHWLKDKRREELFLLPALIYIVVVLLIFLVMTMIGSSKISKTIKTYLEQINEDRLKAMGITANLENSGVVRFSTTDHAGYQPPVIFT